MVIVLNFTTQNIVLIIVLLDIVNVFIQLTYIDICTLFLQKIHRFILKFKKLYYDNVVNNFLRQFQWSNTLQYGRPELFYTEFIKFSYCIICAILVVKTFFNELNKFDATSTGI